MDFIKKIFILVASVAIFSSCSNDAEEVIKNDVKVEMSFGVSTDSKETRTSVDEAWNVIWDQNDKLSIFASGHEIGDVFKFKGYTSSSKKTAYFKGMSYDNATTYYILSPAQSAARLTSTGLKFNIPSVQQATLNSFDPQACVQIGKGTIRKDGTGSSVDLQNVCAFFCVTLGAGCSHFEVELQSTTWYLAGTCIAEEIGTGGVIIRDFENDCTNKVELANIPSQGGKFLLAFIPSSDVKSVIHVNANYDVGNMSLEINSGYQFAAGDVYDLGVMMPTSTPPSE